MPDNQENDIIKKIYANAYKNSQKASAPIAQKAAPLVKPKPKKSFKHKAAIVISILLILFVMFFGTIRFFITSLSEYVIFKVVVNILPNDRPTVRIPPPTNIMFLGYDTGGRSDSIMIMHISPKKNEINVVSIPRDTLATIPGRGWDKINAASAYGGAALARSTIEKFLNIKIPFYVTIYTKKLANIIDQLGGVTLNIERRFYYTDRSQNLYINLRPGLQKLNGYNSLAYMRFRHDDSDIYRISRQQKFLEALSKQVLNKENIIRSPQILFNILGSLDTNIDQNKALGLITVARSVTNSGKIHTFTLAGRGVMINHGYYMKPNEKYVDYVIEHFFKE